MALNINEVVWRRKFCLWPLQDRQHGFRERCGLIFECQFLQIGSPQSPVGISLPNCFDVHIIPTGMDQSQTRKIQEHGESQKPVKNIPCPRMTQWKFLQERLVLGGVLVIVRPHIPFIRPIGVCAGLMVEQGIQFVIAEDRHGVTALFHRTDQRNNRSVLWSHVDEVAEESSDAPFGMGPGLFCFPIPQMVKGSGEASDIGVSVGNNVDAMGKRGQRMSPKYCRSNIGDVLGSQINSGVA